MEVLVAMMVLGIAFSTLFGLISGSMRNVNRLQEHEKITRMAQMKLNELTTADESGRESGAFWLVRFQIPLAGQARSLVRGSWTRHQARLFAFSGAALRIVERPRP